MRTCGVLVLLSVTVACVVAETDPAKGARINEITSSSKPFPVADGFDYPVGPPDGRGYYNAQAFGKNTHLGDDWNGKGGGNTDLGDPVHCIGAGVVTFAGDEGPGWGNVVRVEHLFYRDSVLKRIESLYAHLQEIHVVVGDTLSRGQILGTIGNADGAYWAHLHLEIRNRVGLPLGGGYGANEDGNYIDPSAFIALNRPTGH